MKKTLLILILNLCLIIGAIPFKGYIKYGKYYNESSFIERRGMYNIWNLPSLNPALAVTPLLNNGYNCKIINIQDLNVLNNYLIY